MLDDRMMLNFRSTVLPAYRRALAALAASHAQSDELFDDANATAGTFIHTWSEKYTSYAAQCSNEPALAAEAVAMKTQMRVLNAAYSSIQRMWQATQVVDALMSQLFYQDPIGQRWLRPDVSQDDLETAARTARQQIKELGGNAVRALRNIGHMSPHLATIVPAECNPEQMRRSVIHTSSLLWNKVTLIVRTLCENVRLRFDAHASDAFGGLTSGIAENHAEEVWRDAARELADLSTHTESLEETAGHALSAIHEILARTDIDANSTALIKADAYMLHAIRITTPLTRMDALSRKLTWLRDFLYSADDTPVATAIGPRYAAIAEKTHKLAEDVRDFNYYASKAAPWPEGVPPEERLPLLEHLIEKAAELQKELGTLRQSTLVAHRPMGDRAEQTLTALNETVGALRSHLLNYSGFLATEPEMADPNDVPLAKEYYEAMLALMAPKRQAHSAINALNHFNSVVGGLSAAGSAADEAEAERQWQPAEAALANLSACVKAMTRTAERAVSELRKVLGRNDVDAAWANAAKREAKKIYISQANAQLCEGDSLCLKLEWLKNRYAALPMPTQNLADSPAALARLYAQMLERNRGLKLDVGNYLAYDDGTLTWPEDLEPELRLPLLLVIQQKVGERRAQIDILRQRTHADELPLGRHAVDALNALHAHLGALDRCLTAYYTDLYEEERFRRPARASSDVVGDMEELAERMARARQFAASRLHSFRDEA